MKTIFYDLNWHCLNIITSIEVVYYNIWVVYLGEADRQDIYSTMSAHVLTGVQFLDQ